MLKRTVHSVTGHDKEQCSYGCWICTNRLWAASASSTEHVECSNTSVKQRILKKLVPKLKLSKSESSKTRIILKVWCLALQYQWWKLKCYCLVSVMQSDNSKTDNHFLHSCSSKVTRRCATIEHMRAWLVPVFEKVADSWEEATSLLVSFAAGFVTCVNQLVCSITNCVVWLLWSLYPLPLGLNSCAYNSLSR